MKVRLLLAPLAAALLAAAIAAPAAAAAPRPCAVSGLVIWAGEEPGGGAAGSVFYRLELTNLTARACTVSGYPAVSAVDLKGRRLGAPATHEKGAPVRSVRLAPDQSATATLRIVDALNFPAERCRATTAAGLRVALPGVRGSKVAPVAFETCTRPGARTLAVGPLTARKP